MSLETLSSQVGSGGNFSGLSKAMKELQGLSISVVAGAAAGTKMDLAAIRAEDTILAALYDLDGTPLDDKANITIQGVGASGTITFTGLPVADETVVVNGKTYTFKAAPAALGDVLIGGTAAANATNLMNAINSREDRYDGSKHTTPGVVASVNLGVVTVTAAAAEAAGNSITLTESATNVAVSGAGTLTNGTATGGLKSTTNLTGKTLVVFWFNKR